jgi:hypothetical protein
MTNFTVNEKRIIRHWIDEHGKAIKEGKFGKAHFIRLKLERLGVEGDFECNFEPSKLYES